MGSDVSKNIVKSVNNLNVVNRTDIDIINKQLFETSVESIINVCNSHASIVSGTNEIALAKLKTKGDLNISTTQTNYAKVQFTSEIITEIQNKISTNLAIEIISGIQQNVDQDILSEMVTKATENIKKGWPDIPSGKSDYSEASSENNTDIKNETEITLENIVEICLKFTMKTENINECITNLNLMNKFSIFEADVGRDGNISLNQSNEIESITNCITSTTVISELINNLSTVTGVTIVEDVKQSGSSSTKTEANKTVEEQGIGGAVAEAAEGIGSGVRNVVSGIGDAIGNVFGSAQYIISAIGLSICCILIITVVAIGYILTDETGGQNVMSLANLATDVIPQTKAAKSIGKIVGGFFK